MRSHWRLGDSVTILASPKCCPNKAHNRNPWSGTISAVVRDSSGSLVATAGRREVARYRAAMESRRLAAVS